MNTDWLFLLKSDLVTCVALLYLYCGRLYDHFSLVSVMDDLSKNTASMGGHASDWSLAIHFHAFGWSLAWSLVYSFATLVHQVRDSWKSHLWKSQTASSNRPDKRLVACYIFCIEKSWSLVQLNVAYILTTFYQSYR